jgi:hypothetical protein
MKTSLAIVFDEDRIFLSFAAIKRGYFTFLKELQIPSVCKDNDFLISLKVNADIIDQKIKQTEKDEGFCLEKVFIQLPWNFATEVVARDDVALSGKKTISSRDIAFAKKRLEGKFLNWDDTCIHNIVTSYKVEGLSYDRVPLGLTARRIELKSLLVSIKDKIYKETLNIFDNLNRNFAGFVAPQISTFSSSFSKKEKIQSVVAIDYYSSHLITRDRDGYWTKELSLSLKMIIDRLAQRFNLTFILAEEILQRYVSFKDVPYFKEITIKKGSKYLNLSPRTLNSFVKDYIRNELALIKQEIEERAGTGDCLISFIGRLNSKDGFYNFLKDQLPYFLQMPIEKTTLSSSSGCLRYGLSGFLEEDHKSDKPYLSRILNIYRDYF